MKTSSLQKSIQLSLLLSFVLAVQSSSIHGRSQGMNRFLTNGIVSLSKEHFQEKSQQAFNVLLDSIFKTVEKNMNKTIPLPNFQEKINEKFGFMTVEAKITAKDGDMADMRTIERKADSELSTKGDTITAKVVVGFKVLYATYNKCILEILGTQFERAINISVGENAVDVQIHLTKNAKQCSIKLDHLLLTKFENLEIKISGDSGVVSWLTSKVATFFANSFRRNIRRKIETSVTEVLTKQLKQQEGAICKLFE